MDVFSIPVQAKHNIFIQQLLIYLQLFSPRRVPLVKKSENRLHPLVITVFGNFLLKFLKRIECLFSSLRFSLAVKAQGITGIIPKKISCNVYGGFLVLRHYQ